MKKIANVAVAALAVLALASCRNTNSTTAPAANTGDTTTAEPASGNNIHLQLVPSNDPATLLSRAKALEPILHKYDPDHTYTIDVGTTYAATTTALAAGQIDGGFLTASGYAQMTIEKPGAVELLLSAGRAGYKVQADDFPGVTPEALENQRKHMNGADGYDYKGQQSDTLVNYYCSVVLTLKDSERESLGLKKLDTNGDGEVSLEELHAAEAVWGTMSATSSAGFIYPTKYIYEGGYTKGFADSTAYKAASAEDQAKMMINDFQDSYPAMVENLMNGQIDVAVGFMDIRYGSAFVQTNGAYYQDPTLFTKTYTQAVLDPIMNDTVCTYKGAKQDVKDGIKKALKGAVADGDKNTEGTGAYLLYQIYSHTAYIDGKDSDYESARSMYRWTLEKTGK